MLMKQTLSTAIGENRFFSITRRGEKSEKMTSEKANSNRQN
jgi:hypothetical protein